MVRAVLKALCVFLFVLSMTAAGSISTARAEGLDYKGMVDEIGVIFQDALTLYKKGDIKEAKKKAQSAYFHVFENLEGPIRINVSARKNAELEEEFIEIRKMIVAKQPVAVIEKRINDFMVELRKVLPELEGGEVLVAEATDAAAPKAEAEVQGEAGAGNIEPVWLRAFENIQSKLAKALDAYKQGDAKAAAELVIQTQFDDYKNSLLETSVRRNVSQGRDYENNSAFADIAGLIQSGAAPAKIEPLVAVLVQSLQADIAGLPLVDGAASADKVAAKPESSGKDWSKVNAELFAEIDKAIALYEKGEAQDAVELVQDTYFDVFEASGMEGKLGARDAAFKVKLEGHFNMMISQMKAGAPVEKIQATFSALKGDFEKGAEMLGKGGDSPAALFVYSLLIILREGIEAILIITAIIAYLVKSGQTDKVKVIYNGCISALVLSLVTAVLVKWVFKVSAASQEMMEGGTMLLASVVLFSVSYWLISKAEAQKWTSYIKEKVGDSLSSKSMKTLWFAAFLAVYREGAETVLFYQALASGASASGLTAVAGGFVAGSLALVAIYLCMRYGAVRLPLRPFFLCTGALLYFMAFVFAGNGMMELIEGKLLQSSLVAWMPTIQFMGVHPYLQTLLPQLCIVLAAVVGLVIMSRGRGNTTGEQ
ncbi:MAG TPA: iron permease [Geobacter sp.]|nr:iron permease [Geobacter sp.]